MDKNLTLGTVIGAGMLMLYGEGREVLDLWLGHADGRALAIRQAERPDAVIPDHGPHRDAAGQFLRMARTTQVATPSGMIFYGAPESPAR